ncbi:MucB/RseB C-terminal domain-containing protein [Reinekea blandensis]|uniref:Sigma factor algU negative regulatory protein MucB n=1 Tax=Reinekea blandensis MED297 TaxID=314283 RepID=A4BBJ2_9GAMM|nr:MucB/RseB C-terminal domain-containing protein [Reinekea blandensis]EAR10327.1 sigma factor algU negative regulatory protein MucB [Reinekea sp. MED297] [Reinekea blandensis MED297]
MRRLLLLIGLCLSISAGQAMEWQMLEDMRQAVQQQSYRGEYLHRRGDHSSVYSVVHRFEDGVSQELLRQLDGDMIEVLRQGDERICYLPPDARGALNNALPAAPFSQVEVLNLQTIADHYQASSVGSERVAGYQASIIELKGDDWRYRQRLWLEKQTGLLLQSELIGPEGVVLEQFRFTRLELGVEVLDRELVPTLRGESDVIRQRVQRVIPDSLPDDGFSSQVDWLPAGFERTFSQRTVGNSGWLEQRTYSDGLATVSIFVEQGESDDASSGLAKMGATTAWMTFRQGVSITVVGEVPNQTVKAIAKEISLASSAL